MRALKTQNSNERESAAQMSEEIKSRANLIYEGAEKEAAKLYPDMPEHRNHLAGLKLANVVDAITSNDKYAREWARDEIKRYITIGKEGYPDFRVE